MASVSRGDGDFDVYFRAGQKTHSFTAAPSIQILGPFGTFPVSLALLIKMFELPTPARERLAWIIYLIV